MQLRLDQLSKHVSGALLPIYIISGDEPLQRLEAFDVVLAAARAQGYTDRTILDVDRSFDWGALTAQGDSYSLFADKKIIDLRLGTSKPGDKGGKALSAYASEPPPDTMLLISSGQLDARTRRTNWYKALEKAGAAVQVWPIEPGRFMAWLTDRLRQRGLSASREAITELAARGEGNLLACAQEIERLGLLAESGTIELAHVLQSTSDNARFETFDLVDATLAGNARRGVRILRGLEREGVAPNVVIGTLAWQLRALSAMAGEISAGGSIDAAIRSQPAWSRRRKGLEATLRRSPPELWGRLIAQLARADAAAKGAYPSDPWVELETIVLDICGISAIPAEAV